MADDLENDDQWLYGENADTNEELPPGVEAELLKEPDAVAEKPPAEEQPEPEPEKPEEEPAAPGEDAVDGKEAQQEEEAPEDGEVHQNGDKDEDDEDIEDEDDSDDDVNVVIGDIKSTPSYTALNIKKGGFVSTVQADKSKQVQQTGKFSVEEFGQIGTINGVPATEFNVDSLEEKPWRKPGADITDYFNYGFNEDTWRAYCDRQKRMRVDESGVGLAPMNAVGMPRGPVPIINENSKYSGNFTGGIGQRPPQPNLNKVDQPKMNTIQVMTADRREYSRKPNNFPDMSVPPPPFEEYAAPDYGFNPEPEPFYGGYEPTQDAQWADPNQGWAPNDIKNLTPGSNMGPPPHIGAPPHLAGPPPIVPLGPNNPIGSNSGPPSDLRRGDSPARERSRERERRGASREHRGESRERDKDRERDRERSEKPRDRDRDRERSHRRERSRSRSRRHKSRSRSPSHRSHRKKKSRRHEDSD